MCIIWTSILLICVIFSCIIGKPSTVLESITSSSKSAIENVVVIASMLLFWSGIFNILSSTSFIQKVSRKVFRLISFLFRKDEVTDKAKEYISLNVVSNLMGVGNAATINSLKGIEEMQKSNVSSRKLNKSMATLILLNTCSLQLIPTSMISLRTLYNSKNPEMIILPVIIVSFVSLVVAIISLNILWRFYE